MFISKEVMFRNMAWHGTAWIRGWATLDVVLCNLFRVVAPAQDGREVTQQYSLHCSNVAAQYDLYRLSFRSIPPDVPPVVPQVAYRDVKLDNLLVDGRDPPRLKVTDFGVAKAAAPPAQVCGVQV